ncbi:ganglioside-induced differentiation-associated protein 1-like [Babylonia areolata]|uniref:ganglioside-induced differentiation-associated protein 1-like n=1 Tax=Babylonia areolata TaxID=304850 RepID=UPI003FD4B48D
MSDRQVRLYYHPLSFFSQVVLVALREKEVKYEPVIVDIIRGEQIEAWYMRINSDGAVPTLQDGEKTIRESAVIVDYIDKEFPTDSKLVPDMSTEMGKEVSKWRGMLNDINMYAITYGTFCFPEFSVSGIKIPKRMLKCKTEITATNQIMGKKAEQLADEHPDLREAYSARAAAYQKRPAMLTKENVTKQMDDLETVLDQVEEQLLKVEADPSKELWFCGQQFTAADISLCVLMNRLHLLGLGERYHDDQKRPRLHAYWGHAKQRSSVKRHCLNAGRDLMKQKLAKGAKTALPVVGGLVAIGLAAGLAFLLAQKR